MNITQIPTDNFYLYVAEKIRAYRVKAGMDQETFSRHLGLSRTTIINIEKGRQRLSLEQAWLTEQILGIPISDLLPPINSKSIDDWTKAVESDKSIEEGQKESVINFIYRIKQKK